MQTVNWKRSSAMIDELRKGGGLRVCGPKMQFNDFAQSTSIAVSPFVGLSPLSTHRLNLLFCS
jgi:hypothetical protein